MTSAFWGRMGEEDRAKSDASWISNLSLETVLGHWCSIPQLHFKRFIKPNEETTATIICKKLIQTDVPQNTSFQFLVVKLHGVPFKLKFSQFKTAKESVLRDTLANTYKTPETIIKSIGKFPFNDS